MNHSLSALGRYEEPPLGAGDGRDWLRHELAFWDYVSDDCRRFLDVLPLRQRNAVVAVYGYRYTLDQAAYKLGVSPRTLQRDIACAAELAERREELRPG